MKTTRFNSGLSLLNRGDLKQKSNQKIQPTTIGVEMTFYKKLKTILVFAFFMAVSAITNAAVLTTYYHNDQLGSPIAATDEYGFKLWTENYQAYGERTVNNTNAQENRFWFTGKPQDSNRGDNIVLSNPVKNINKVSGAFRQELDYLIGKGFKLSNDGSKLVK